jgi:hypothetical protein
MCATCSLRLSKIANVIEHDHEVLARRRLERAIRLGRRDTITLKLTALGRRHRKERLCVRRVP